MAYKTLYDLALANFSSCISCPSSTKSSCLNSQTFFCLRAFAIWVILPPGTQCSPPLPSSSPTSYPKTLTQTGSSSFGSQLKRPTRQLYLKMSPQGFPATIFYHNTLFPPSSQFILFLFLNLSILSVCSIRFYGHESRNQLQLVWLPLYT